MNDQQQPNEGNNVNQTPDRPEAPEVPQSTQPTEASTTGAGGSDQGLLWAVLGYVVTILFFVPLVSSELKNNQFSRFHANQQLVLLIAWVVSWFIGLVPIIGWILAPLLTLALIVFTIMGIINAVQKKMKPLPLIGKIQIIK